MLQILAGLKPDRLTRRNFHFLLCPRIPSDSSFSGLYLKDPESTQLNSSAIRQRIAQRIDRGIYRALCLRFRDLRFLGYYVDKIRFDHLFEPAKVLTLCQRHFQMSTLSVDITQVRGCSSAGSAAQLLLESQVWRWYRDFFDLSEV